MNTKKIRSSFQSIGTRVTSFNMTNNCVQIGCGPAECKATYTIENLEKRENDGLLLGIVALTVTVKVKADKALFSGKLVIEGGFTDSLDVNIEDFKKKLSVNGCTLLYSASRAFISSVSALSASGGTVILPMINTFKLAENGEKPSKN